MGPYVEDLSKVVVENYGQMMTLMDEGNQVSRQSEHFDTELIPIGENRGFDQYERDVVSVSRRIHCNGEPRPERGS